MGSPLRVMMVEDSPVDTMLLLRELNRGGYEPTLERVETAAAMWEALDRTEWDVIIADHQLPTFSATAALEILKRRGLDLPFIIVSGTIDEAAAVASLKAGAHDFVVKDNLARLLPAIERELREARVRREHRRAEEALRESEEKYRIVVEHASDAILITDEDSKIQYANPVTQHIFGYATPELIGQPIDTLVQECRQPRDCGALAKYITAGRGQGPRQRIELRGLHKTGRGIRLEASIGGAVQNGRYVCICILRDVTERRRAEVHRERLYHAATRARRAAEAARREAERANQAKSEFLAMMSHELRTPLTAIIGYEELLADQILGPLSSLQTTHLARIKVNSDHLLTLIDEILTFARVETGRMTYAISDVPLRQLLSTGEAMIAPSAREKGVSVLIEPFDPGLAVRADANRLQQVLGNLLTNAVKFTEPGGRVIISCDASAEAIRIRVRDTGCGIPAEKLDAIFDPFVQVDTGPTRKSGGVGLGLAISRDLVLGMGGRLSVESTCDVGSVFTITLPHAKPRESACAPMRAGIRAVSAGTMTSESRP